MTHVENVMFSNTEFIYKKYLSRSLFWNPDYNINKHRRNTMST